MKLIKSHMSHMYHMTHLKLGMENDFLQRNSHAYSIKWCTKYWKQLIEN
jgi:hypothetical protein